METKDNLITVEALDFVYKNLLDKITAGLTSMGVDASIEEINYLIGVTSPIQTQIDNILYSISEDKEYYDQQLKLKADLFTAQTYILSATLWDSNSQTISVANLTLDDNVIISATPDCMEEYCLRGIMCVTQADGQLTFTCNSIPECDISISILIM